MFLIVLLALCKLATSCSHVCIDGYPKDSNMDSKDLKKGSQFCARTMEQLTPFDYLVEGTARDTEFKADFPLCANHDGKSGWKTNYNYVSVNIDVAPCKNAEELQDEFLLCVDYEEWNGKATTWAADGINEHGLAVSMLAFVQRSYSSQEYDPKLLAKGYTYMCYMDFVAYALGMFKTIDEMIEVMTKEDKNGRSMFIMLDTKSDPKFEKLGETTHWSIQDATGRNVVLEYNVHNPGKPIFYDNTAGVLTNNPDFQWHMTNLNNYLNLDFEEGGSRAEWKRVFGETDKSHKTWKGEYDLVGNKLGVGANFLGMPGDFTPPSRFVRLYYLKKLATHQLTPTIEDCGKDCPNYAVPFVENLIGALNIPRGTIVMEAAPLVSQTQWTVIKVPKERKFYWKGSTDHRLRMIDLSKMHTDDFDKDFSIVIEDWNTHVIDETAKFQNSETAKMKNAIKRILSGLKKKGLTKDIINDHYPKLSELALQSMIENIIDMRA